MTSGHPHWDNVMLGRWLGENLGILVRQYGCLLTAILFCLSFSFSARTLWISALSARRRSWKIMARHRTWLQAPQSGSTLKCRLHLWPFSITLAWFSDFIFMCGPVTLSCKKDNVFLLPLLLGNTVLCLWLNCSQYIMNDQQILPPVQPHKLHGLNHLFQPSNITHMDTPSFASG